MSIFDEDAQAVVVTRPRGWKAVGAAALSILVPGLGHVVVGRRRRALWFFAFDAIAIAVALWVLSLGSVGLLELLVQPRWVRAVVVGNLLLGLLRFVAAIDVLALERPRIPVAASSAIAVVLLVVLVAPHLFVMQRAVALLGLLEGVFPDEGHVAVALDLRRRATEAERAAGGAYVTTTIDTGIGIPPIEPRSPDGVITPRYRDAGDPVLEDIDLTRVTILLAGGDAGPGRGGLRTDTMIIASLDVFTGEGVLITLSRELTGFILPPHLREKARVTERQQLIWDAAVAAQEGGYTKATEVLPEERDLSVWLDRINALYPFTYDLTGTYPDDPRPGMAALKDTIAYTLGIGIDYYVLVDMAGFVDLVDAMGGVTVTARESMDIRMSPPRGDAEEFVHVVIEPGRQRMDGITALIYVRNRTGSSDVVRTRRQRCFVREVVGQFDTATVVSRFDRIASAIQRNTETDIPLFILPALVRAAADADTANIASMGIQPGYYSHELDYRGLPVLDVDRVRRGVDAVMKGLETGEPVVDGTECG